MDTNSSKGLTSAEAQHRLKRDGYNELPKEKNKNFLTILISVLTEPMLMLLVSCGIIYLIWGELQDALLLLSCIVVVITITYYQERKTQKTLDALRNLSSPRALVIRDGEYQKIPGREVVKDDIVLLVEGDRVPADAILLNCQNLSLDESLLTGESMAVRKTEGKGNEEAVQPGGDDQPFVYAGTLVVHGRGTARIIATGSKTQMGKIGKALETIKEEDTLLHKETSKWVRYFTIGGIFVCFSVMILYTLTRGDILQGFLSGLTLSMSLLPEEFPVVLLIFLTLGAWRISKQHVLARRAAAIETLGAASVLCVDKTGTITLNRMELTCLYRNGKYYELSGIASTDLTKGFKELLHNAVLASQKDPFDPLEKELIKMDELYSEKPENYTDMQLVKEYPLTKQLFAVTQVWRSNRNNYMVAAKGAPEAVLDLCNSDTNERHIIENTVTEMSKKGLRIIAVARAVHSDEKLPDKQQGFNFEFTGLLGFIDPVRDTVKGAINTAYAAGMRVIMITGDYPGTAQFIAGKIGLKNIQEYITGEELAIMPPGKLKERIKDVNIFARVIPEQKLLIVDALKANGEIVAMTGDGVNDAPALKAAHIGIAMGERGTDVAREASALVLLDDDFSSIVTAVRLGRRIFNNIKRAVRYIIAIHIPIAGIALLPLLFNLPMVLMPAHIAFLELIIDPACSVVFESVEEDDSIMKKPPRKLNEPLFNKRIVTVGLLQGISMLLVISLVFLLSIYSGKSPDEARTFAFVSLILSNLILISVNLTWSKNILQIIRSGNKALYIITGGGILALILVLSFSFTRELFHLSILNLSGVLAIAAAELSLLLWFELLKLMQKDIFAPKNSSLSLNK